MFQKLSHLNLCYFAFDSKYFIVAFEWCYSTYMLDSKSIYPHANIFNSNHFSLFECMNALYIADIFLFCCWNKAPQLFLFGIYLPISFSNIQIHTHTYTHFHSNAIFKISIFRMLFWLLAYSVNYLSARSLLLIHNACFLYLRLWNFCYFIFVSSQIPLYFENWYQKGNEIENSGDSEKRIRKTETQDDHSDLEHIES